ncbi:MAG: hypothetical protein V8R49_03710 [Duodenibacillus massiliensis]
MATLERIRLPFYIFLPVTVMLRFIPTFTNDIKQVWKRSGSKAGPWGRRCSRCSPCFRRASFAPVLFRALSSKRWGSLRLIRASAPAAARCAVTGRQ